ncbi:hypothetical protein Avbf_15084, partial [Armadillidium vulgare]
MENMVEEDTEDMVEEGIDISMVEEDTDISMVEEDIENTVG